MYVLSAQTTLTIFAQKYIFVNAKILILSYKISVFAFTKMLLERRYLKMIEPQMYTAVCCTCSLWQYLQPTLFKHKRFMCEETTYIETLQNFPYFWNTKNPCTTTNFSFWATIFFSIINDLTYVGIHQEKDTWVFIFQKYGKF